jgi:hypothetical protein
MWKFRELQDAEPERDPHEAEFFKLTHASEAVIREFIQNSLDARQPQSELVKVRFVLGAVHKNLLDRFLGTEFRQHLEASDLSPADYRVLTSIPFLTMEDYGTTGLDGETGEIRRPEGRHNFYNFWWWEGKSAKKGPEAGRWGLGKTTFHMISKLRTFWGLTARIDDGRKLLLGKVLLKAHRINGKTFDYRGYYVKDGRAPIDSESLIVRFRKTFSIQRTQEPGLSLVIPMPEVEIDTRSVIRSVILHYFYAIMSASLEVDIDGTDRTLQLDSVNLAQTAVEQDWQGTAWDNVNIGVFLGFIKNCIGNEQFFSLPDRCGERFEIDETAFGENLESMRAAYADSRFLSIRVPVQVKEVGKKAAQTYFDIYLKRDPTLKESQEYYIRSGITIVGIRNLRGRPVKALLVAKDPKMAQFLGDAETPAHTEWNERTEDFRNKYENAADLLRFVKKSMMIIVSHLDLPPSERQLDFLRDVFFVPVEERDEEEVGAKKKTPEIVPKAKVFRITPISSGFKISLQHRPAHLPLQARVMLAYDVRRGNPFRQYEPKDFDLSNGGIRVASTGCKVMTKNENILDFEITQSDFWLQVTGFDPQRDLIIAVKEQ